MARLSQLSQQWLTNAQSLLSSIDKDLMARACIFSEACHAKIPHNFADSLLEQGFKIAETLFPLNIDSETLAAAIAYPTVYYGQIDAATIEKHLGHALYKLLSNTQRIKIAHFIPTTLSNQTMDNLRKMLLAIIDDIRIVFIKLAECLVTLKYLCRHKSPEAKQIAQQVLNIYAPLANRLGIGQLKWQLEDFAFRLLDERKYKDIKQSLNMRREDREQYIKNKILELTVLLENQGILNVSISGRAKHIYSIYRKMQTKQRRFEQLFDTLAFRILTNTVEDCYQVLSTVHSQWSPIKEEFDDYISQPKPNGYQSIHTAVIGPDHMSIEIQIRTYQMHQDAELGIAAHWKYKEGGQQTSYEEKMSRLREIMQWGKNTYLKSTEKNIYSKIFEDRIYVFTPKDDIIDLTAGATPLDFAYRIHTEVGHRCRGVKVNRHLVALTHPLKTGDRVEILTSNIVSPSRDWLNPQAAYLKTKHARQKVQQWFKKAHFENYLMNGTALWERHASQAKLKKSDIHKALKHFQCKTSDHLLAAIGHHDIRISAVINYLLKDKQPAISQKKTAERCPQITEKTIPTGFAIEGVDNLLVTLGKCCYPIPGDPIMGYVTKIRGVTIHHQNCRNIQAALQNQPKRILKAFCTPSSVHYPAKLLIQSDDRSGLLSDISACIANQKMTITHTHAHLSIAKNHAYISLVIKTTSLKALQQLLLDLQKIPNVIKAERLLF